MHSTSTARPLMETDQQDRQDRDVGPAQDYNLNTTAFRLLDLPPELWIKIGKYAVDNEPLLPSHWGHSTRPEQPPITRTSAALRSELLPYYYQTSVRLVFWPSDISKRKCTWLEQIGPANRRHIKEAYLISAPIYDCNTNSFVRRLELLRKYLHVEWDLGPSIEETLDKTKYFGEESGVTDEVLYRIIFK